MDKRCEAGMAMYTRNLQLHGPRVIDLQPTCSVT